MGVWLSSRVRRPPWVWCRVRRGVPRPISVMTGSTKTAGACKFRVAWRLGVRSHDHYRFNEVTDELYLSLWPFSGMAAALSAVAAIAFVVAAIGQLGEGADQASAPGQS